MLARAGGLGETDAGAASTARLIIAAASRGLNAARAGANSTLAHRAATSAAEPVPTAGTLVAPAATTADRVAAAAATADPSVATTAASAAAAASVATAAAATDPSTASSRAAVDAGDIADHCCRKQALDSGKDLGLHHSSALLGLRIGGMCSSSLRPQLVIDKSEPGPLLSLPKNKSQKRP